MTTRNVAGPGLVALCSLALVVLWQHRMSNARHPMIGRARSAVHRAAVSATTPETHPTLIASPVRDSRSGTRADLNRPASEEELDSRFEALARDVSPEDMPLVLSLMLRKECQPPSQSATVAAIVLRRWAAIAPADAAAWVEQLPETVPFKDNAYRLLVEGWAEKDLPAAARWVEAIPDSVRGDAARSALALEALDRDAPMTAVELLKDVPAERRPRIRPDVLSLVVGSWARTAPDAAVAWISGIPDAALREPLLREVAELKLPQG